jgi:hypothetical protein
MRVGNWIVVEIWCFGVVSLIWCFGVVSLSGVWTSEVWTSEA